jgi:predicted transcriptional regulator
MWGASFKMLKRHIGTEQGLTPEEYRQRFGLGLLYPLVAADYAERRSAMAGTKARCWRCRVA